MVIWFIGLSGAGKTVIGKKLSEKLREMGRPVVFVDGDIFRSIMGNDLGHTIEDRKRNADRICKFCQYFEKEGVDVVFAVLSLFHESQEWNRKYLSNYFEVYLDVSIETVKRRDSKGLYKKALRGEIKNVVGFDIQFKPPLSPDMVIDNNEDKKELSTIVDLVLSQLKTKGLI